MASDLQILIVIAVLCFISFVVGWAVRDAVPQRFKRFKIKRRHHYRVVPYTFKARV